jgi:RNA polymerase-binding transcription factor DksA
MATKKKAAKPVKKPTNVKKIVPAKKAAAKPAQSSGGNKLAKKGPVSKSIAKPVAKKVAMPAKKTAPVASKSSAPASSRSATPVSSRAATAVASKSMPSKSVSVPSKKPVAISKPAPGVPSKGASAPAAGVSKTHPAPVPATAVKQVYPPVINKPAVVPPSTPPFSPSSGSSKAEPKKVVMPGKPVKVVIPEMKTKTVRKYEPEFTKSVLDTPQEEQTGPTMRYSDAELGEFRELINRKLDAAKKELAYLQGLITRKDEMGGDNDDARYMTMEDGSMSMEREQLSQMASRQITFIDHLEKAIMRIENKTYGICRVTGKLIDKARLRAVPHATLSIEAKQMMNK